MGRRLVFLNYIAERTFDFHPKSKNNAQGIVHKRIASGNTAVFDTWDQQSMIGIDGWEIIKLRYT